MRPFFSIILPTYNRAEFLDRCIISVLNQSVTDWELLIIDDGSIDNTGEVVEKYTSADGRIKYIYQTNQKTSAARNLGLKKAAGKYICFIDSDDEYDNNHLETFFDHIQTSDSKFFYYTKFRFKEGDVSLDYSIPQPLEYDDRILDNIMQVFLPYSPPVQTICLPGEVKELVSFNIRLFPSECYDFCAKCAAWFNVAHITKTTVTLHGHSNNSSVPRNLKQSIAFNERQLEEFKIMRDDSYYARIKKTKVFRNKFQNLYFELSRGYAKGKKAGTAVSCLVKGVTYYPQVVFSSSFISVSKNMVWNFFSKN